MTKKVITVAMAIIVVLILFFATLGLPAVVGAQATTITQQTFQNNEDVDVNDLHVEFWNIGNTVTIESWMPGLPSPFTTVTRSENKKQLDCANGTVEKGASVEITFTLSGNTPILMEWWWTKDGEKEGDYKSRVINPVPKEGGRASIPLPTDEATVDFPPGALEVDTVVTLSTVLPIPNPTAVPQGFLPIIKALGIQLEPDPETLGAPATVTIPYTDEEIEGYNEETLQILGYDDNAGTWYVIPSTVDTTNNVVTCEREEADTGSNVFDDSGIGGRPKPRGGCFIATAAYGTPMAKEIGILREFRDQYLLTNPAGEALVELYYKTSPPIANFITEHPALKPVVRAALVPAIAMSTVAVNTTLVQKIVIVGSMALVSVLLVVWIRKRAGKVRSAN